MIDKLSKYILPVILFLVTNLNVSVAQPEFDVLSVSVTDILNVNNSNIGKYQIKLSESNSVSGKAFNNTLNYQKPRAGKKTIKGMLIGVGIGGLAGGTAAAVFYKECKDPEPWACLFHFRSRGEAFTTGAVYGGVVGGIVGIIIGAIADSKRKSGQRPSFEVSIYNNPDFRAKATFAPVTTLRLQIK